MTESKDPIYFTGEQRARYAAIRAEYAKRREWDKTVKSARERIEDLGADLAPFTGGLSLLVTIVSAHARGK